MSTVHTTEKSNRFNRLAERRVTETIKKMRLIGNLANKHNYSYTDEQVKQILEALESEIRNVKARFRHDGSSQSVAFSFRK